MAGKVQRQYPPAEALLAMVEAKNVTQVARDLGIPRPTLQHHVGKLRASPAPIERDGLNADAPQGEIPVIVREYDAETHFLYPMGDSHLGSPKHHRDKWCEWVKYVQDRGDASVLGTGDWFNTALKTSVSDVYEETMTLDDAKKLEAALWEPMAEAGRLDGVADGNHERRLVAAAGTSPVADLCWKLDVPYIPASALVVYRIGDVEYEVYLWHGSGSGRASAQAGRMERQTQIITADIYISGHTHRQQVVLGDRFYRGEEDAVVRAKQYLVTSGSFVLYENYAAQMGLPPAHMGAPRIRLDGRKKDAHVSL